MYVPEDYENYKYLVSANDNFVVLTNTRNVVASWDNPKSVNVVYQYFIPSIYTISDTVTFSNNKEFTEIETSTSFYDRADCPQLITCSLLLIFFLLFIFNGVTKFARRGGIFGQ